MMASETNTLSRPGECISTTHSTASYTERERERERERSYMQLQHLVGIAVKSCNLHEHTHQQLWYCQLCVHNYRLILNLF